MNSEYLKTYFNKKNNWLILTAFLSLWRYFMPMSQGIVYIVQGAEMKYAVIWKPFLVKLVKFLKKDTINDYLYYSSTF